MDTQSASFNFISHFIISFFTISPFLGTCPQSLLPPSCMVVPIRELANTLYPFTSNLQNNQLELSKRYSMDIEIDFPRGCSASPSMNSSRETSASSAISSMDYVECVQAQVDNLTQAEQVKNGEIQSPFLFYTTAKNAIPVTASVEPVVEPIYVPHAAGTNNETIS